MGILEELQKPKPANIPKLTDSALEAMDTANKAITSLNEANNILSAINVKHEELKEENLKLVTIKAFSAQLNSFEAKFDTLVDYLKLSTDVLEQEKDLLSKIEGELAGT